MNKNTMKTFEVTYEPMRIVNGFSPAVMAKFQLSGYKETMLIAAKDLRAAREWFYGGNNARIIDIKEVL